MAVRAIITAPAHKPSSTSTTTNTPIFPPSDRGKPARTRTRTPPCRLRVGRSSSCSSSNSVNSWCIVLYGVAEPLAGLAVFEACCGSGASSTPIPRLEDSSLFRKPEQGRENRHPDYIPHNASPKPQLPSCTLSGTHPICHSPVPVTTTSHLESHISITRCRICHFDRSACFSTPAR